jgi:hypothetical protein
MSPEKTLDRLARLYLRHRLPAVKSASASIPVTLSRPRPVAIPRADIIGLVREPTDADLNSSNPASY